MTRERRSRIAVLMVIAAVAIPLAIVSTAWACGRLANLELSKRSARPGTEVSGVGRNYNAAPTSSDVVLHLSTRGGPVLWQGRASASGKILPTFEVPKVKPGYYTVLATQTTGSGVAAAGTPGRAVLRIRKTRRGKAAAVLSPWSSPANGGPTAGSPVRAGHSPSVPTPALLAAIAMFAVLSGGAVALLAGTRRSRPA